MTTIGIRLVSQTQIKYCVKILEGPLSGQVIDVLKAEVLNFNKTDEGWIKSFNLSDSTAKEKGLL